MTDQVHELQALQQFAVPVLEAVSLVDDHAAPLQLLQLRTVGHDHLEGGDHPVELQHVWDGSGLQGTPQLSSSDSYLMQMIHWKISPNKYRDAKLQYIHSFTNE